ncbi:hypothetical protein [Janibacter alkaliphilus]|uniref:Uncharacterized protein n=1 Tax=Janibacter alkaliphilus TaxID=1069963 RepID=A0A852X5P3_9MICO|nr:hypothetical protein [Janibacter alkaliphilus]NYG36730.1 hypothetical protein [Janibacter alkaliphilus]
MHARRSAEMRERESRWWEQARWASEQIVSADDPRTVLGVAALRQLVDEGDGEEASRFAVHALSVVLEATDDVDTPPSVDHTGSTSLEDDR